VRVWFRRVRSTELDDPSFTPGHLDYELRELVVVSAPDELGRRRFELELPPRLENEALLYWFEAQADEGERVRAPEAGALAPAVVAPDALSLDFPRPRWPLLSQELPCRGDRNRVFDGGANEATLVPAPLFKVITQPIWRTLDQATILANRENLQRGIGVEIEGEAYFFPLIVMLWNEVSNQAIGGRLTALTYCPLTDTGLHFDTGFDPLNPPKWRNYAPAGLFNSNLSVAVEGLRSGEASAYNQMLGFAFTGPEMNSCLDPLPSMMTEINVWRRLHPDTWILEGDVDLVEEFDYLNRANPYALYWRDNHEIRFPVANEDARLPNKSRVMGILASVDPLAVPLGRESYAHNTTVADLPIVVLAQHQTGMAFERRHPIGGQPIRLRPSGLGFRGLELYTDDEPEPSLWTLEGMAISGPLAGHRLPWMPSMSAFWFAWAAIYPQTRVESP
jgi:hypothetical protein